MAKRDPGGHAIDKPSRARRVRQTPGLALLALTLCHCGSTATISRHTAPDLEARIVGGDARYLVVRDAAGQTFKLPREDVADIDHPGNAVAVGSLPVWGIGALYLAMAPLGDLNTLSGGPSARDPLYAAGVVSLVIAALMTGVGVFEWQRSRTAASPETGWPSPSAPASLPDAPTSAVPDAVWRQRPT